MVANIKMTAFWYMALHSLTEVHWHFRGAYCLHHQGDDHLMMKAVRTFEKKNAKKYQRDSCRI